MCARCPFAFLQPHSPWLPLVRRSSVPSGCHQPLASTISMMAAHCIGSYGPSLTSIHTIIPGLSRRPFSRVGMWKKSLRFFLTAAGKARSSSGRRARVTGLKQAISTALSACLKEKAGQSSRLGRTHARPCFGGLAIPFSAEPGMSGVGVTTGRPSRGKIASFGWMMPGDYHARPVGGPGRWRDSVHPLGDSR